MQPITLDSIKPQELEILGWLRENNLVDKFHLFLTRGDSHNRFITGIMGWHWEDEFIDTCTRQGMTCTKSKLGLRYDLVVNGKKVQCKFSNSEDRVDIRNKDKNTNRRYKANDFDFIAIRVHTNPSIYIIPMKELLDKTGEFTRGSINLSEYERFIDNYAVLKEHYDYHI